jgi:hypothetical protein
VHVTQGVIIKTEHFGMLDESEMFRDDLWYNMPDEEVVPVVTSRIQVVPHHNPMVQKAQEVFRDALKK